MEINITFFSVLLIILLFIPGFFFKRFYYIGQFTKQFASGSFAERFLTNIFWGLIIQVICLSVASRFIRSDYKSLWAAASKYYEQVSSSKLPNCTPDDLKNGMVYVIFCVVVASLLGAVCHYVVRLLRIDRRFTVLRFANYWNYYFRGDIPGIRSGNGRVLSTVLDILVEDKAGGTKMYKGFLAHYNINPATGGLETIALTQTSRWSKTQSAFVPVAGDAFLIPYATVVNVNVTYNTVPRNLGTKFVNFAVIISLLSLIGVEYWLFSFYPSHVGWLRTIIASILAIIVAILFSAIMIVVFDPQASNAKQASPLTSRDKLISALCVTIILFVCLFSMRALLKYPSLSQTVIRAKGSSQLSPKSHIDTSIKRR